jgi:hypothetical protein
MPKFMKQEEKPVKKSDVRLPDEGKWFRTSPQFYITNFLGETKKHLFFDSSPLVDLAQTTVDVLVVTPKNSKSHFELDVFSGRRVFSHAYCSEKDVWNSYQAGIELPPYTEAVIPRVLDIFKKPQRVIIFGDREHIDKNKFPFDELVKVKVVGGVVEQFCEKYPCQRIESWKSRVILLAVSLKDPKFNKVKTVSQLKELIDWKESKAFLENGRGRNIIDDQYYPAYRIINDMMASKAFEFSLKSGHVFDKKEMRTLRNTCEIVYNKLWKVREDVLANKTAFNKAFLTYYEKYWSSFKTCTDFVRYSNINYNSEQHWFFEYMRAFVLAERENYVYLCNEKRWKRNVLNKKGKKLFDSLKSLRFCDTKSLNLAFEKAINLLTGLSSTGRKFFEYKDYDHKSVDLNNKLYSWIERTGKYQYCSKERFPEFVFPEDISWKYLEAAKENVPSSIYISN